LFELWILIALDGNSCQQNVTLCMQNTAAGRTWSPALSPSEVDPNHEGHEFEVLEFHHVISKFSQKQNL